MEVNEINHLQTKSEFLKSRKKLIFRKAKKIEKKDFSKLGDNPFKESWRFNATCSNHQFRLTGAEDSKSYSIYTADEKILKEVLNRNFTPYLLEGKHIRIHLENNQDLRNRIYRLKSCSHTLLFWILFSLEYGNDFILLNKQYLMSKLKVSKQTLYKAINQLMEEQFIQKTEVVNHYWFNAQFFFVGNRCHYLPEFVTTREGLKIEGIRDEFINRNKKYIKTKLNNLTAENP